MFWENFQKICKEKGTSPNGVCHDIGLSNASATHWKNGTQPKADVLVKIAKYLDVSVDYLLGVKNEKPLEPIALRASVSEWTELLNLLSDENLIKLRDYAQLLILQQHSLAQKEDQGSPK